MGTKIGNLIEVSALVREKEDLEETLSKINRYKSSADQHLQIESQYSKVRKGKLGWLFKEEHKLVRFFLDLNDIDEQSQLALDTFITSLEDDYKRRIKRVVNRLIELEVEFD